ncbi:MAG: MFS transporter [Bacillota bacterium]|nr:MFS transporter [Bacillota bacterium]
MVTLRPRFLDPVDPTTRHNLKVDIFAAAFFAAFFGLTIPFLGPLVIRMGGSPSLVGLIAAGPFLGLLLAGVWGHLSEGRPKLPYVVVPALLARLLFLPLAFTVHPTGFAALAVLYFLINGIQLPAYTALMQRIYPREFRGRLMALVRVVLGLVQVGALRLAGGLMDQTGHRAPFLAAALLGGAGALVFSRIREPLLPEEEENPAPTATSASPLWSSFQAMRRILNGDRRFARFELGFMIFGLGNLLLLPVYTIFQVKTLGLNNSQVAWVTITWSIAWLWGYLLCGQAVDSFGPRKIVLAGVGFYALVPLAYLAGHNYLAVLIGSAFLGLGDAAVELGWMNEVISLAPGQVSTYAGIHLSLLGLRGSLAPLLGPYLALAWGTDPVLLLGLGLLLLGLGVLSEPSFFKTVREGSYALPSPCTPAIRSLQTAGAGAGRRRRSTALAQ